MPHLLQIPLRMSTFEAIPHKNTIKMIKYLFYMKRSVFPHENDRLIGAPSFNLYVN